MKNGILIQARTNSSRFPNKVFEKINNTTLIQYVYNRCSKSNKADEIIVITSLENSDNELASLCESLGIKLFRGSLQNVYLRYLEASKQYSLTNICRVCGDSPFVDIYAIDEMFNIVEKNKCDYCITSNCLNGFLSEVFTVNTLKKLDTFNLTNSDLEHVTKFIRENKQFFNTYSYDINATSQIHTSYTLTIDYPEDLITANKIAKHLVDFDFSSKQIINILTILGKNNEL